MEIIEKIKEWRATREAAEINRRAKELYNESASAIKVKENERNQPTLYFCGVELLLIANETNLMDGSVALGDVPDLLAKLRGRYIAMRMSEQDAGRSML